MPVVFPAQPMSLFAPSLAFVDLETTGMNAADDAITEIGIVRVDADPAGVAPPTVSEWSTLVNPGTPIPPAIQSLTGITDAMVRDAPPFRAVAGEVIARTAGALFVAHNARFDYGFLKHAFAREGTAFSARVLCTVKLSRRLYPEADRHNLDSLIARHALGDEASPPRAGRRPRAVGVRAGALPRLAGRNDRRGREARAEDAEPASAIAARRDRRAPRRSGRLSVLRAERAAALHRQEPQPARARRRALLVGLSVGDGSAALRGNPAHRTRGDRRRARRAAARIRAREVAAAGAQPRTAAQERSRRARAAGDAGTAALRPGGGCRRGRARGPLRSVHVEAAGPRNAAASGGRARAVLEGARAGKADGRVLRAPGQALRRRLRRRGIHGRASRASCRRPRAAGDAAVALQRTRGDPRAGAPRRAHRRPRDSRLVLARHRARRRRARPAWSRRRRAPNSTATSRSS